LLSGVAVTSLQDVIDDFYSDSISKNKIGIVQNHHCHIRSKIFGALNARRLRRSGAAYMAPRSQWRRALLHPILDA
jgi:hypothetical protein